MGPGLNCYSSVHAEDVAELYRLALESAPAGSLYHAVSGEMPFRVLAEAVAAHLAVGTKSVTYDEAHEIWGPASARMIFAVCSRTQCPRARTELGWSPDPGRLDILAECAHPDYAARGGSSSDSWMGAWEK
jgi:nucleoside-diphosphate-sugar epimerase